ncbi:MAG: hypothetical protein M1832_003815 [Thelocarpon impressellum]|nr:MAG: hypothetical protein M1832_003815 [Thelocarpon impressellum]
MPDKNAGGEEDWPVLFPERASTSPAKQDSEQQGSASVVIERFPKLTSRISSGTEPGDAQMAAVQGKSASRSLDTLSLKIPRKPVQGVGMRSASDGSPAADMSASAAALEKAGAEKPKNFSQPRQTRTSSLRARISAGALSTEGAAGNKVVGFTDFTNGNEPARTNDPTLMLAPPPSARASSVRGRRTSARGGPRVSGHQPAKVVAGSRRPETHRPTSSSSLRTVQSSSAPAARERRSSNASVTSSYEGKDHIARLVAVKDLPPRFPNRQSSIPVLRQVTPSLQMSSESESSAAPEATSQPNGNAFDIFEDHQPSDGESGEVPPGPSATRIQSLTGALPGKSLRLAGEKGVSSSDEESYTKTNATPAGDRLKRLSKISPENGPTLKISKSAERVIMGDSQLDKENSTPHKGPKKGKDLHRAVVTNELRKASKEVVPRAVLRKTSRPRSAGSQYELRARAGISSEERAKKVKSAEIATMKLIGADADPFVDAQPVAADGNPPRDSSPDAHHGPACVDIPAESVETEAPHSVAPAEGDLAKVGGPATVPDPELLQVWPNPPKSEALSTKASRRNVILLSPARRTITEFIAEAPNVAQAGYDMKSQRPRVAGGDPMTPAKPAAAIIRPPRTSSRAPAPDYTVTPRAGTSNPHMIEVNSRLSRDFLDIQNKLGSSVGIASTQVNVTSEKDKRASGVSKSESQASRRSSQRSNSKTMLSMSNLRGIFRKQPAETKEGDSGVKEKSKQPATPAAVPESASGKSKSKGKGRLIRSRTSTPGAQNAAEAETPTPQEIARTTSLAIQILNSARSEEHSPTKERLLEMGKVMVDAITHARDAEKAMEEAKLAADRAGLASMRTKKSVLDVARLIQEWKDTVGR